MKIVIIGPGAMGCLYAGLLARSGYEVWLLDKYAARAEHIRAQGLKVEGISGNYQVPFKNITADARVIGQADFVIVFVKAYDTGAAIQHANKLISEQTTILTLQNGLGNIDEICKVFPKEQVVAGTTAHGATLLEAGHIRHAGIGETIIGGIDHDSAPRVAGIKEVFDKAGIAATTAKNINGVLWGKLLINIGINPLTAIVRIKNGQILQYPDLVAVMHRAVEEAAMVAKALGVAIAFADPIKKVTEVCRTTAENRSSMLQDIEAGKKTEIDYINGAVVRYGRDGGVATPVNCILTGLVKAIEERNMKSYQQRLHLNGL